MSESSKLRLVRCPKCENLLPELLDYSVYQCGGCGAVLRSKNKDRQADSVSDKSEEERVKETSAKSVNSSDEGVVDYSETSDSVVVSNASSLKHEEKGPEPHSQSQVRTDAFFGETDPRLNMNRDESGTNPMVSGQEDLNSECGLQSPGKIPNPSEERIRTKDFGKRTAPRKKFEDVRLSSSKNLNDQAIDRDRAELLRKLDELKEQLSRSNLEDKSKEKLPSSSSLGSSKASIAFSGSDKHVTGPYYNHYPEPSFPYFANRFDVPTHGLLYNSSYVHGYGDPLGFQMHRRPPQPSHPYYSGQYVDNNQDMFDPYPQNGIFSRRVSAPVLPPRIFSDVSYKPGVHPHENLGSFGTHNYDSRIFRPHPPSSSLGSQAHARWSSDIRPDMGVFSRVHPPKVVLGSGVSRHIRPLAGGAPFLTCQNCFELLQLPNLAVKKKQRLQCGACFSIFDFSFINKKLVLSVLPETKPVSTEVESGHVHRHATVNFSSDDDDNSGYEFHSVDEEPGELSNDRCLISNKPQEMQNLRSSLSSSASEDEHRSDSFNAKPPVPNGNGSPLQDQFDHSSANHAVHNRYSTGNQSARSEQEKVVPNKVTTRQNSLKEVSVYATEMDVSYNEYSNTNQDSMDGIKEDDQVKPKKVNESFFVNIVKKSFKDLKKSSQNEECRKRDVWVNGHPISERLVKKAEKKAGTIKPGNYWYDYRSGFWGVMDGPCLGIIPPFIEELNYPIPEDCAGGNTGVLVNGRELHEKDLELLAARGLPTDRDKSYIIEISGRVLDEDTGEELDSLGKIAPTVEKLKRGFGMKLPRTTA